MATERTFSIIKPDATARNLTGAVNALIEKAGLRIVGQKRIRMTREQAETFYAVHKARPFFGELVEFMTSGPVVVQVLEGENAVLKYRDVMGATDPSKAAEGTIRKASCEIDRREFGAWFGRAGDRGDRDRPVLFGQRDRRLIEGADRSAVARGFRRAGCELAGSSIPPISERSSRKSRLTCIRPHSGLRSARSSGSTCCCPVTTRSSSRWHVVACVAVIGCGA